MTTTPARLMTAEDLWELPDDGLRHELVRGVLTTVAPPDFDHGLATERVSGAFRDRLRDVPDYYRLTGDSGFTLVRGPDTVRAPDYALVHVSKLPDGPPRRGYALVAPDLALEVRSPEDRPGKVEAKTREWLDAGCRVVVNLDPLRGVVEVRGPQRSETLIAGDVLLLPEILPGLEIPVDELIG
jgi:Uma2 family endonuclease